MEITLDADSGTPMFRQLADQLRVKISQGELVAGDPLPSVRQMAAAVRVNLNTVAKAYRLLAEEGLVDLSHGKTARVIGMSTKTSGRVPASAQRELEAWIARLRTQGVGNKQLERAFSRALALSLGGR